MFGSIGFILNGVLEIIFFETFKLDLGIFNPWPADFLIFLNGLVHIPFFGTVHYHFNGYQDEILKLTSHQYRVWSDYTDVQAGLALYWW